MDQHIPTIMEIMGLDAAPAPAAPSRRKDKPDPDDQLHLLKGVSIMSKNGQPVAVPIMTDPEKTERVQAELEHLEEIFQGIDENKRDFVQRHIEQLAWYNISIADLQAKVDKWGTLISYNNGGNQTGLRSNPDLRTLLDFQKTTNTIVRTLISLVPEKRTGSKLDFFFDDEETEEEKEESKSRAAEEARQLLERIRNTTEQINVPG